MLCNLGFIGQWMIISDLFINIMKRNFDTLLMNEMIMNKDDPSVSLSLSLRTDVLLRMVRQGAILTADDLQRFRDQRTVTEEQAHTVEAVYKREDNWRRRAHYVMFLSSIRDLVDVEHGPGPSAHILVVSYQDLRLRYCSWTLYEKISYTNIRYDKISQNT